MHYSIIKIIITNFFKKLKVKPFKLFLSLGLNLIKKRLDFNRKRQKKPKKIHKKKKKIMRLEVKPFNAHQLYSTRTTLTSEASGILSLHLTGLCYWFATFFLL